MGLNDLFGSILDTFYYFSDHSNDYDFEIDVARNSYSKITNFLNIHPKINILQTDSSFSEHLYQFKTSSGNCGRTLKFSHEQFQKVFKFKESFLSSISSYPEHIGVHFRMQMTEGDINNLESQKKDYLEKFLSKYKTTENYIIVSDSNIWKREFENYSNIKCYTADENINFEGNKIINREKCVETTLKHICILASCKQIYR